MKTQWYGHKIKIEYICHNDIEDICRMLEKESVCRWLFFGPNTHEVTKAYFTPLVKSLSKERSEGKIPTSPIFTIRTKDAKEFSGQCALLTVEFCPGTYLIAYQIDDNFMGIGFGREACEFLIYYAFTQSDAYRLNGDTAYENTASWKIMERCGFSYEGKRSNYWSYRGRYHDQVIYGLLKENVDEINLDNLRKKWES